MNLISPRRVSSPARARLESSLWAIAGQSAGPIQPRDSPIRARIFDARKVAYNLLVRLFCAPIVRLDSCEYGVPPGSNHRRVGPGCGAGVRLRLYYIAFRGS